LFYAILPKAPDAAIIGKNARGGFIEDFSDAVVSPHALFSAGDRKFSC
jgi:hypothetical protein